MDIVRNQIRASMPADYFVISRELGDGVSSFQLHQAIMFVMVGWRFVPFSALSTPYLMAVLEQHREVYLKCVGAGKYDLIRLISLETTAIALAGSLAGALIGMFFESGVRSSAAPVSGGIHSVGCHNPARSCGRPGGLCRVQP
ncbi:MAG: hypothetical protein R2874_07805 [Desulfobacterales bacterium]